MAQKNSDSVHSFLIMRLNRFGSRWWLSLMLSLSLLACTSPADDATQVRQGVELLAKAIEQHERDTIMQRLDDDFRTREGLLPQDINRMLFVQFRQNKQIQVFLFDMNVNVMSNMADVQLEALLLGSSQWLPERGRRYRVQMRWNKRDGEWLLLRLDWQPI
ncbi:MAG: hypothetical protein HKM94_02730 [Halobacteria archaeon]|nr:hypothetical protein [Halobacteria archaeon]